MSGVSYDKREASIQSNIKTVCCVTVPSRESSIYTYMACRKVKRISETTNMEESDGTDLKPILPIHFFNKFMKIEKCKYSDQTSGMRCRGILVCRGDGKC